MAHKIFTSKSLVLFLFLMLPIATAFAADKSSSSSANLSSNDEEFIKEAAPGGLMEVQLGKLAQEKASNEKVKEFGKRMESDHGKANDELKTLASKKGVEISTQLDSKHQSQVDKLSKVSGADFDKQYVDLMVSDHRADIKKFQNAADKSKDSDVKQFASKTLPTLKEHLKLAESTQKELKSSKSEKSGSTRK